MAIQSVLLLRVSSAVDKVDHPQFFDPSYPLKTVQAGLQQYSDITVHLHDCWIHPMEAAQLLDYAARLRPDVMIISASSFDVEVANALVSALKQREDAPVVIGVGQGYYLMRDLKRSEAALYDAILLGEPEEELLRWAARMGRGETLAEDWRAHYRQCYEDGRRFEVEAPDDLPFPSYTPEELRAYKSIYPVQLNQRAVWGFLIATRGCPYACAFCSEVMRVSIGKKLRGRTPANVADEMEHLAQQGVNICSFQDDSFSSNRHFVRALCEELAARGSNMPWMARVRVDEVDYETLSLMKRAGCVMLGMGVESGSQRLVDEMLKTYRSKPWIERCRQTFRWTRELGIGTNAYYIIGNPTETRTEIEQTIDLALELNADTIQVHFYTPYPGSADWERYKYLLESYDLTQMFHYATPMFSVADVSVEELVELRAKFYRRYLFRPGFMLLHLWRHAGFYWRNPDVFWSLVGIRKVL